MRNLLIDPETNDIAMDDQKSFKMVEGDDELIQSVGVVFKTAKGSWFLNPDNHGFDRTTVQTKVYDEVMVTDALFEAALQEDRIANIEEITFDYDKQKRKLAVDFKFNKADGSTVEGGV